MGVTCICDGQKYTIGGPNSDTIALPIVIDGLPKTFQFEGNELQLRSSFHVSLVCIGHIMERNNIQDEEFIDKVVSGFCEFTNSNPVELKKFTDEFWFVSKAERRTIAIRCEISNLNKFFDLLNSKYNLKLEYPPTHVTLYTLQKDMGIFVTDSQDIKNFTKKISPDLTMTSFPVEVRSASA